MIIYPKDDKLESKFVCALSHPTFIEGLNWLIVVEYERAKSIELKRRSQPLSEYKAAETMFEFFIREFTVRWHAANKPIDLVVEERLLRENVKIT